jgi:hypothetical protein
MVEVTYTDLNKYVILHMSKWVDPRSGEIHRVEYRRCRYLSPGVGWYLAKWQDGEVQTLSRKELQAYVNLWKNDSENNIPHQVVDELKNPTYEVVLQFQENEGVDRHLVEIRKYANDDHQLYRDRHLLKRLNSEEFAMELQLKQQWEAERRVEAGLGTLLSALVKYANIIMQGVLPERYAHSDIDVYQ